MSEDPWALANELEKDIFEIAELTMKDQGSMSIRRSYVRTVFAALEGILYMLRMDIIHHGELDKLFTPKQRAKLLEKVYKGGVVQKDDKYLPLKEAVKFVPECFAIHMGIKDFNFPHESLGWKKMQQALKLRNEITHPKTTESLKVSVSELEMIIYRVGPRQLIDNNKNFSVILS